MAIRKSIKNNLVLQLTDPSLHPWVLQKEKEGILKKVLEESNIFYITPYSNNTTIHRLITYSVPVQAFQTDQGLDQDLVRQELVVFNQIKTIETPR